MMPAADAPVVAALTHRLAECPGEFLQPPLVKGDGLIHVDAVVSDVVRFMGGPMPTADDVRVLRDGRGKGPAMRNHLQVALIASWLLRDPCFAGRRTAADRVLPLMTVALAPVAAIVAAPQFVGDPDRREELVRLCLRELEFQPSGESPEESADRLAALDSVQRHRVAAEAKKAEERAERIREAMKKKEAEEAAARYGRE